MKIHMSIPIPVLEPSKFKKKTAKFKNEKWKYLTESALKLMFESWSVEKPLWTSCNCLIHTILMNFFFVSLKLFNAYKTKLRTMITEI